VVTFIHTVSGIASFVLGFSFFFLVVVVVVVLVVLAFFSVPSPALLEDAVPTFVSISLVARTGIDGRT
jgi:hypothetical protein